jgi:hypothetical protein
MGPWCWRCAAVAQPGCTLRRTPGLLLPPGAGQPPLPPPPPELPWRWLLQPAGPPWPSPSANGSPTLPLHYSRCACLPYLPLQDARAVPALPHPPAARRAAVRAARVGQDCAGARRGPGGVLAACVLRCRWCAAWCGARVCGVLLSGGARAGADPGARMFPPEQRAAPRLPILAAHLCACLFAPSGGGRAAVRHQRARHYVRVPGRVRGGAGCHLCSSQGRGAISHLHRRDRLPGARQGGRRRRQPGARLGAAAWMRGCLGLGVAAAAAGALGTGQRCARLAAARCRWAAAAAATWLRAWWRRC